MASADHVNILLAMMHTTTSERYGKSTQYDAQLVRTDQLASNTDSNVDIQAVVCSGSVVDEVLQLTSCQYRAVTQVT